jgi:nitroimidazol reductase NimA-like FMN-containing flavoprotein (pyridoxamine 5'-phosphate oxidase superfamily)
MVRTPLSREEVHELLAHEKICWLGTISPKGEPHLIPIYFGFFDDRVHIIFVSSKSKSIRNVENNQSVCFGINVGEREGEIRCVLISGKAEVTNNVNLLKRAYRKILTKYSPSKKEGEEFLQKLIVSGAIAKRVMVVIKPAKIISWKL